MKNKTTQIILVYLVISLFLAIVCHKFLVSNYSDLDYLHFSFLKDLTFIVLIGFLFKYILVKNEQINKNNLNDLKKINQQINESNEKYNIVAKATSDTIWDWKIQEDTIIWNKGIHNVFGYKKTDVGNSSKWWFNNIHPEDSIKMSVKLYAFLEQKTEKWQDQYRFRCADGTYKYVLDRGFLLKDKNGKAIRMIGALQDITNQKEEEQRLKLLETVITQAKDAVVITKPGDKNNPFLTIIYINPAFTTMTGYEAKDILGKSPILFKGPQTDEKEVKRLIGEIKNQRECFTELLSYKKNGDIYWVQFSMIPIFDNEKKLSHWVSIQRDITEVKKAEKEKEQLIRELTQNNKDLKQFSYITSHNLRAPLSNLTGLLNLIDDIEITDNELSEILDGFKKSTQLLSETINDLVKVIVIKDNPSVQKETIVLKDAFSNVLSQLNFQIQKSKTLINLEFDSYLTLKTNKSYLESIILNLVTNSIKYKKEETPLEIEITAIRENDKTIIHFKDNGIGIDLSTNQDKIFGLYQRFHNFPDSKGLGLYLVKSQVETMGGTITINSEVNVGTEFTITL
ncbi:PAS domain-containing sensor histidine kinase [Flavobacterium agrisoli]|uniref:histidine kinase n=1 Tax=Flavobacterium agrisoli TaxID=2793066 RepID=A0A934PKE4_9FLAO|nr:PAS domain-containing sensor histidine kinase [Flavobacterium agrisoli]MBK0369217.1 PAS domain S-box protein [Flavobacterium agrisoli]